MMTLSPSAQRLVQLYQRSLGIALLLIWLGIGVPCLWVLRLEVGRLFQSFTWVGLKFAFFYQPGLASLGMLFCFGFTLYVLLSLCRYELLGVFRSEQAVLEWQVQRIRALPLNHPIRRWVIQPDALPSGSGEG